MHRLEPEPLSVQVVEWVGLVGGGFQLFTRLAAVFAEEVIQPISTGKIASVLLGMCYQRKPEGIF